MGNYECGIRNAEVGIERRGGGSEGERGKGAESSKLKVGDRGLRAEGGIFTLYYNKVNIGWSL